VQEAIAHYQKALEIRPDYVLAHHNLGQILQQEGQVREAVTHFQKALEVQPDFAPACNSLAWVLATSPDASVRDGARAIRVGRGGPAVFPRQQSDVHATAGGSLCRAGRFPEAIETAKQALQLAPHKTGDARHRLQAQIASYQAGAPYATPAGRPQSRDSRRGHDGLGISRRCRESSRPAKNLLT